MKATTGKKKTTTTGKKKRITRQEATDKKKSIDIKSVLIFLYLIPTIYIMISTYKTLEYIDYQKHKIENSYYHNNNHEGGEAIKSFSSLSLFSFLS